MAGRQVLIAGHPRRTPLPNQLNINVKKETYIGGFQPMQGYYQGGCYDNGGIGTFGKIMLGLGAVGMVAGGILDAVNSNKDGAGGSPAFTPEQQEQIDAQKKAMEALKEKNAELEKQLADLKKQQAAKAQEARQEEVNRAKAAQAPAQAPTIGAEKVENKPTTTTFTVKASKTQDGKFKGHTGYNIVAGMYKGPDGKPLTSTEIKAIAKEIFQGKALPTGDIQLPNEVTVNGKTYTINPDAKAEDVQMSEYNLAQHEVFQSGAQKVGEHWVGTIDGKQIDGEYATEEEAKAAAQQEADKRAAENEE